MSADIWQILWGFFNNPIVGGIAGLVLFGAVGISCASLAKSSPKNPVPNRQPFTPHLDKLKVWRLLRRSAIATILCSFTTFGIYFYLYFNLKGQTDVVAGTEGMEALIAILYVFTILTLIALAFQVVARTRFEVGS